MARVSEPFVHFDCSRCGRTIERQIIARRARKEIDELRDQPALYCAECEHCGLESGKTYKNKRGDEIGPMEERTPGVWLDQYGGVYHPDGRMWDHVAESTATIVIG